jgi:hypothetical protein
MSLTDIVTYEGAEMEYSFSRGNVGVLTDVQSGLRNEFTLPALGGIPDYPSENDVRLGVTFDVYTGNLELPAEADVLTGVQYGTNGTEFTGSATGGGGGDSEDIILNVTKGKLLKRMTNKLYFDL